MMDKSAVINCRFAAFGHSSPIYFRLFCPSFRSFFGHICFAGPDFTDLRDSSRSGGVSTLVLASLELAPLFFVLYFFTSTPLHPSCAQLTSSASLSLGCRLVLVATFGGSRRHSFDRCAVSFVPPFSTSKLHQPLRGGGGARGRARRVHMCVRIAEVAVSTGILFTLHYK